MNPDVLWAVPLLLLLGLVWPASSWWTDHEDWRARAGQRLAAWGWPVPDWQEEQEESRAQRRGEEQS